MPTRLLGIVVFLSLAATLLPAPAIGQDVEEETPPSTTAPADAEEPEHVSPRIILATQKPPRYPPAAFAARYTGQVMLEAVVKTDGSVGEVKVLECSRPKMGFEEAAVEAVTKWRFEPGRIGEEPAEVTLRFRLNFAPGGVSLASETVPGGTAPVSASASATSFK